MSVALVARLKFIAAGRAGPVMGEHAPESHCNQAPPLFDSVGSTVKLLNSHFSRSSCVLVSPNAAARICGLGRTERVCDLATAMALLAVIKVLIANMLVDRNTHSIYRPG